VKKIIVGLLSQDMVHADFACALHNLGLYTNVANRGVVMLGMVNHKCSDVAAGRNEVVRYTLQFAEGTQATHLLMVDSDMVFPAQAALDLAAHETEVVGCRYSRKRPPFDPVGRQVNGQWELGCGLMLVSLSVFRTLKFPWFDARYLPDGKRVSEDQDFCQKCNSAGFRVMCDEVLSRKLGHLGSQIYLTP
jgi:hypothetical protein